jgi:DNA polymerase kappa
MARKYGVRSAMPGFIGRRLCPQLVFVKPDFSKYVRVAGATRAIFVDFDPDFEAGSLDEAYLDVTDYCHSHSTTGKYMWHRFAGITALEATLLQICALIIFS